MIRIKNVSKIEQTIALEPSENLSVTIEARIRVDQRGIKKIKRTVGSSIRLQPGESSEPVPDETEKDPNVAVLVHRGIVKIEKI